VQLDSHVRYAAAFYEPLNLLNDKFHLPAVISFTFTQKAQVFQPSAKPDPNTTPDLNS